MFEFLWLSSFHNNLNLPFPKIKIITLNNICNIPATAKTSGERLGTEEILPRFRFQMPSSSRSRPNILITGTPGTGKSTLAGQIAEKSGFTHLNVGEIVSENELYSGYDEQYACKILDEEKLLDFIEDRMDSSSGGYIVDYHGCDFFTERWFNAVFVLRTDNTILYDRLATRGYNEKKMGDNIECEIFGTLLEEAQEAYKEEIVHEIKNDNTDDMERNIEQISQWIVNWK